MRLAFSWIRNKLLCSGDIPSNLDLNMILGNIRKVRILQKQHHNFTLILQKSYRTRGDLQTSTQRRITQFMESLIHGSITSMTITYGQWILNSSLHFAVIDLQKQWCND